MVEILGIISSDTSVCFQSVFALSAQTFRFLFYTVFFTLLTESFCETKIKTTDCI